MRVSRSWIVITVVVIVGAGTGTAVALPGLARADDGVKKQAASTCQGQPATIEGNLNTLNGTPGNDVIVAGGNVHHVVAGEGDDLICVIASDRKRLMVLAGPGADIVDTTASTTHVVANLGTGADTYLGGPEADEVRTDEELTAPIPVDVVRTGGSSDFLTSESTVDADLGEGDDFYVGEFTEGQGPSRVLLGQGDDVLRLDMGIAPSQGRSSDSSRLPETSGTLRLDLAAGTLVQNGVKSVVSGQEEVIANGRKVWVQGSRRAEQVVSGGCQVTMHGGAGRDELIQVKGYEVLCNKRWARLYGDGGPDRLQGTAGNDVLIGGSGKDQAYGMGGRDRCVAERTFTCER